MKSIYFSIASFFLVSHAIHAGPVLLYEEDPTLLTTTVHIEFLGGAVFDPKGRAGVSDLLSELLLRGTKKLTRSKFQRQLELIGGALGSGASRDDISVSGSVIKENTDSFFKLIQDAITQPDFNAKEFSALKKERIARIRYITNSNGSLGGIAFRRVVFKNTPLQYPVAGTLTSVNRIQLKDLWDYYGTYFNRENIIFAVASPFKKSVIEKHVQKIWNLLPEGQKAQQKEIPLNLPKRPEIHLVHKANTSTAVIIAGQGGIKANDPERFPLLLGNFGFGGGDMVSRLFKVIRAELGWTYAVTSTYFGAGSLTHQQGVFLLWSTPSINYAAKTTLKLLNMWDTYAKNGAKREELDLAKESEINSYPFMFDSPNKRLGKKLYAYRYGVPELSPAEYKDKINSVTNKQLTSALSKVHTKMGWVIAVVADKNVFKKQLAKEQVGIPKDKRLTITKIYKPSSLIR